MALWHLWRFNSCVWLGATIVRSYGVDNADILIFFIIRICFWEGKFSTNSKISQSTRSKRDQRYCSWIDQRHQRSQHFQTFPKMTYWKKCCTRYGSATRDQYANETRSNMMQMTEHFQLENTDGLTYASMWQCVISCRHSNIIKSFIKSNTESETVSS